jgi:hypothetical protein
MKLRYLLLLILPLFTGCQVQEALDNDVVTVLKRSNQCRITSPELRELKTMQEYRGVFLQDSMMQNSDPVPDIDLSNHVVMLLAMGEKPSAGYAIQFSTADIERDGETLKLNVKFSPPKGDIAATVITSPCLVFAVKRDGWSEIVAGDTGLVYRQ